MQQGDKEVELTFPVLGLNVATEFGRQPKQTTPSGNNVQGCEPLGDRIRGGARPGLTRFLQDMTPAGDHLIQHLNVIVDPQSPALATNDEINGDAIPDPDSGRYPSRLVRDGGDAVQMNKSINRSPSSDPIVGTSNVVIEFVDEVDGFFDFEITFNGVTLKQGNGYAAPGPGTAPVAPNIQLILSIADYNTFLGYADGALATLTLTATGLTGEYDTVID